MITFHYNEYMGGAFTLPVRTGPLIRFLNRGEVELEEVKLREIIIYL